MRQLSFRAAAGALLSCALLSCNKQNDARPDLHPAGNTAKTGLYNYASKSTEEVIADARAKTAKPLIPTTGSIVVKVQKGLFDDKNSTDDKIVCTADGTLCAITIIKTSTYLPTAKQTTNSYTLNGSTEEPIELIIAKPSYPELKLATKVDVAEQNGVTIINADYVD